MLSSVRIVSYNVLSSHLSSASHYPDCHPDHCDPPQRYNSLLKKLHPHINQKSIICLQEVSLSWFGPLKAHFSSFGYDFVCTNYGALYNGFMGVGIAYDMASYQLKDIDIVCVSDTKKWIDTPPSTLWRFANYLTSTFSWVLNKLMNVSLSLSPTTPTEYGAAKVRQNRQIMLKLEHIPSQRDFSVATYHMPCAFTSPRMMNIHCALSCQAAQRFAEGGPLVFCGDFNFKPDSSSYGLVTTGKLKKDNEHPAGVIPIGDDWIPVVEPMRSAYSEILNKEPAFTNYTRNANNPVFFGTLDYIFLSKHWKVQSVVPLPQKITEFEGPLPCQNQPSDHLLISSEIELYQ